MKDQEQIESRESISSKRLWFGFAGAGAAWTVAGLLNVLLAWQACLGGEEGSFIFTDIRMRIVLGVITFGLLAAAAAAGWVSYQNWRALSDKPDLESAEGRGRQEFMALFGLVVSVSLGVGIAWFAVPIYILGICVRAR